MMKNNIKNLPIGKFANWVSALGLKPYAVSQIISWLYKKGASGFEEMTNLSKEARRLLGEQFYISRLELAQKLESVDGTQKFAWKLDDGNVIESVLIPAEGKQGSNEAMGQWGNEAGSNRGPIASLPHSSRLTLCISTQVGCAMGCTFCRTAKMGFVRNLTQAEILDQVLEVERLVTSNQLPVTSGEEGVVHRPSSIVHRERVTSDPPASPREAARLAWRAGERRLPAEALAKAGVTNVVLMGMGEPLANYDNVIEAIKILLDTRAFGLSKRHVTLSTVGLVPAIERLAKDRPGMRLAISLNATTDEVRDKLMPINKKYPLAELMAACRAYAKACEGDRITFEYVMIAGVNDSIEDAKRLVKLLSHVPSKVNLIPLNPWKSPPHPPFLQPEADPPLAEKGGRGDYQPSDDKTTKAFANYLRKKHIQTNLRTSRGHDIMAACGQLAGTEG